jgi:hypothetical protein
MKTSSITRTISFCLACSFLFFACQKEQTTPPTEQEREEFAAVSAESDAEAETIFNDVFDNVMGVNSEVAVGNTGVFNVPTPTDTIHCYVLTVTHLNNSSVFPIRIVLDFGAGCIGRDGRTRKGKIIAEYSNRLTIPGATATTIFDGYMVNDIKVEGKQVVTNKSTAIRPVLEVNVVAKLSHLNGNFSEWFSNKTVTQVEGQLTPLVFDDVFTITGSATGTVKKDDKFFQWATMVTEPLRKKYSCRWIVQGTITIKKGNSDIATLGYGTGQCDDKASFTVLGHVREISLH